MDRKTKLLSLFRKEEKEVVAPFIDEILGIERNLEEIKKLPLLKVKEGRQKITAAGRLYTALLAQYSSAMKTLYSLSKKKDKGGAKSPLQEYFEKR